MGNQGRNGGRIGTEWGFFFTYAYIYIYIFLYKIKFKIVDNIKNIKGQKKNGNSNY